MKATRTVRTCEPVSGRELATAPTRDTGEAEKLPRGRVRRASELAPPGRQRQRLDADPIRPPVHQGRRLHGQDVEVLWRWDVRDNPRPLHGPGWQPVGRRQRV